MRTNRLSLLHPPHLLRQAQEHDSRPLVELATSVVFDPKCKSDIISQAADRATSKLRGDKTSYVCSILLGTTTLTSWASARLWYFVGEVHACHSMFCGMALFLDSCIWSTLSSHFRRCGFLTCAHVFICTADFNSWLYVFFILVVHCTNFETMLPNSCVILEF